MTTLPTSKEDPTWQASGFFALRTPLLPLAALAAIGESPGAVEALSSGHLDDAIAVDCRVGVARLRDALREDPVLREAIFLASPSLDAAVDAWLRDEHDSRAAGVGERVLRYLARMSVRATPFGFFAGSSVGSLGKHTSLVLGPRGEYRRHSRLDTHYLDALCEALRRLPEVRRVLRYAPNTSLYAGARQYRYVETNIDHGTRDRRYSLVSAEWSAPLQQALDRARGGATLGEVAAALSEADPDVAPEEATEYVHSLVEAQLLVSELEPAITGPEAVDRLLETLDQRGLHAYAAPLRTARDALRALDAAPLGQGASRYRDLAASLEPLPERPDLSRLIQVDLYKPAQAVLGESVVRELERTLHLLGRIGTPMVDTNLRAFQRAFEERYETREVPLTLALDDEAGVGFHPTTGGADPSPLLQGLPFRGVAEARHVAFGPREERLLQGITRTVASGAREWALSDDDVDVLTHAEPAHTPDAVALWVTLAARSAEHVERGDFRLHVHGANGPSGALLLGRFCLGDPVLRSWVEAHTRAEEALQPEAVFAEVVHLPESRQGNILARPALREWEIPYLGRGSADSEHTIPIDDIMIAVQNGRLVLRSRRLDRKLVPRLTSAINYTRTPLGLYRFLAAFRNYDGTAPVFTWGPLENASFLPRVARGRIVLSPAQWTLDSSDLAPLAKSTPSESYRRIAALRDRYRLPRWVGLVERDNILPVDLEHPLHVASLLPMLGRGASARLVELVGNDDLVVRGPEGGFTSEILVPFVKRRDATATTSTHAPRPRPPGPTCASERTFLPGSRWLYAKLYTGTASADVVLRDAIAPLVDEARREGLVTGWFFIRYDDPHHHLRVRFRGDRLGLAARLLPRLQSLAEDACAGLLWRVQLDTYQREVERYGGPCGIELAEDLFEADSDAVLRLLAATSAASRPLLAVRGVHSLLLDLGLDLRRRLRVIRELHASYSREYGVGTTFKRKVGAKFRAMRAQLEAATASEPPTSSTDADLATAFAAFAERSPRLRTIGAELQAREDAGDLAVPLETLAASFVHMHVNRALRSNQRQQELVVCDFLERLYVSEQMRDK